MEDAGLGRPGALADVPVLERAGAYLDQHGRRRAGLGGDRGEPGQPPLGALDRAAGPAGVHLDDLAARAPAGVAQPDGHGGVAGLVAGRVRVEVAPAGVAQAVAERVARL